MDNEFNPLWYKLVADNAMRDSLKKARMKSGLEPRIATDLMEEATSNFHNPDAETSAAISKFRVGKPMTHFTPEESKLYDKMLEKHWFDMSDAEQVAAEFGEKEADRLTLESEKALSKHLPRVGSWSGRAATTGKFPSWLEPLILRAKAVNKQALFNKLFNSVGKMNVGTIIPDGLIQSMYQKALQNRRDMVQGQRI